MHIANEASPRSRKSSRALSSRGATCAEDACRPATDAPREVCDFAHRCPGSSAQRTGPGPLKGKIGRVGQLETGRRSVRGDPPHKSPACPPAWPTARRRLARFRGAGRVGPDHRSDRYRSDAYRTEPATYALAGGRAKVYHNRYTTAIRTKMPTMADKNSCLDRK